MSLNRFQVQNGVNVNLVLRSPSRETLEFDKALTDLGSGFYSISLSYADTISLVDDTYSYYLYQDEVLLKHGRIRLIELELNNSIFDYTLDFLLG